MFSIVLCGRCDHYAERQHAGFSGWEWLKCTTVVEMNHYSLFVTKNAQAWSTVLWDAVCLYRDRVTYKQIASYVLPLRLSLYCTTVAIVLGPILPDSPTVSPNCPDCPERRVTGLCEASTAWD